MVHEIEKKLSLTLAFTVLAIAVGCGSPTAPTPDPGDPPADPPDPSPTELGLVEVTISGIGSADVSASAAPYGTKGSGVSYSVGPVNGSDGSGDGTIQLEPISTGSFTSGDRGAAGERFLRATFRVRNAQEDGTAYDRPRENLTFLAVDTDGTLDESPVTELSRFDGSAADVAIVEGLRPTGAATRTGDGTLDTEFPDVLQVLTEEEVAAIDLSGHAQVNGVFPYGFVVRSPDVTPGSRALPAGPEADEFDGVVTFAFRLPLQATENEDPFEVSVLFLPVDDTEVRITESLEERTSRGTAALRQRAEELGPTTVVTLLGGSETVLSSPAVRRVCAVRVAGNDPGSPASTLVDADPCDPDNALPGHVRAVDADAGGGGDGTSWEAAFGTLQDALACARDEADAGGSCEGVDELWVAGGVYYPDEGAGVVDDAVDASFSLIEGVSLYGGFAGGEISREQREPGSQPTILSGDIDQDDVNADGDFVAETIADHEGSNADVVITADGISAPLTRATVVDGFTITAAAAGGTGESEAAALTCDASVGGECSPTLRDLTFSGNWGFSGGALSILAGGGGEASPRVEGATFVGNSAIDVGGAVYVVEGGAGGTASPVFVRVTFTGNDASDGRGGAVGLDGESRGTTEFYNAVFRDNEASSGGGAIDALGAHLAIVNSAFWSNVAGTRGGAVSFDDLDGGLLVSSVTFSENVAGTSAGALNTVRGTADLRNVIAWGDTPDEITADLPVTADFAILEGGCPVNVTCTNILDTNPEFVDGPGGDLRPQNSSPAVDAGSASHLRSDLADLDADGDTDEPMPLDLADRARVVDVRGGGAVPDMGAYERP